MVHRATLRVSMGHKAPFKLVSDKHGPFDRQRGF